MSSMDQDQIFTLPDIYNITVEKFGDPVHFVPIGDIHYGSPKCDRDRFLDTLKMLQEPELSKNQYIVFMGDETDFASATDRGIISNPKSHSATLSQLDADALRVNKELMQHLLPFKNRILGMVQGNHYWEFLTSLPKEDIVKGMSSTAWLCRSLGTRFLGYLAYMRIIIHYLNTTQCLSVDIVVCHGKAGGKLIGASINQVNDLRSVFPGADVYVFGHDHQRYAVPVSDLSVTRNAKDPLKLLLKQKRKYLVRSGSFERGYVPEEGGYVMGKLLRPAELGIVVLKLEADRVRKDGVSTTFLDIHAWS